MTVTAVDAGPHQVSRCAIVHAAADELFAIVADPRRHRELDGSGTVGANVRGPAPLTAGARFSTKMKMFGLPYRITSTVTESKAGRLIQWRHPFGHSWRWEFEPISSTQTRVTETFDYRDAGGLKNRLKYYEATGFAKRNGIGIQATLKKLQDRYSA
jgi:hypothetical protein